jgi:hypothetical protein
MVVPLSDEQRAVHIPRLVEDLAIRLSKSSAANNDCDAIFSAAAVAHGELRYLQGYTPAMLVDESRILEVTVFGMCRAIGILWMLPCCCPTSWLSRRRRMRS